MTINKSNEQTRVAQCTKVISLFYNLIVSCDFNRVTSKIILKIKYQYSQ